MIKRPYSNCDMPSIKVCTDPNSSCKLIDSKVSPKTTRSNYHQVQLQLYVGMDLDTSLVSHTVIVCAYACTVG